LKERAGLYIHFPFCAAKCPYCHFASQPWTPPDFLTWRECLEREAALSPEHGLVFDTIYLGGGTPSLLEPGDIAWLLDLARSRFSLKVDEFTLEANPAADGAGRARGWREAGVTRLSVGVQSFDEAVLRTLGRNYTAEEALRFCRAGRMAGFEALSIDLMIGIPGETPAAVASSLDTALALEPDHVSLYILENVEGLPFAEVLTRHPVDEDAVVDAYGRVRDALEAAGLRQYEISNFARPGKECRHNLKYWRYEPFLGLGPSAGSHLAGRRWSNTSSLETWSAALKRGDSAREDVVELDSTAAAREALIFGLRLVEGVDVAALGARYGVDLRRRFGPEIDELLAEGMLALFGGRLMIPPGKLLVSNWILNKFV
jgi:oxygen-independent coproporphyrinogen-3 oxidase